MAFQNNAFCWHGVTSTDTEKAKQFYADTIGWKAVQHTFENGDDSTMFVANDVRRAHLTPPFMDGEPSHWSSYLRVEDVDEATKKSTSNGGSVLVPPTDIAPGRFSVVTSPGGAALSLFHEVDEDEAQNAPQGVGSVHWTELHSQNIDADLAWLKATFGFEVQEMPIPDGNNGTYYILNVGGQPVGGAMGAFSEHMPGMWVNWVQVANVDDTLARVKKHGGQAFTEVMEMPGVGRMAMVSDSTNAVFGIITPPAA